jgi:hypothetical protein
MAKTMAFQAIYLGSKQELFSKKLLDAKNRYLNRDIGSCKGFGCGNPSGLIQIHRNG